MSELWRIIKPYFLRFIDTENDPHNAKRGLWYSHIGWIFEKGDYPKAKLIDIQDLLDDPGTDACQVNPLLETISRSNSASFLHPTSNLWCLPTTFSSCLAFMG